MIGISGDHQNVQVHLNAAETHQVPHDGYQSSGDRLMTA